MRRRATRWQAKAAGVRAPACDGGGELANLENGKRADLKMSKSGHLVPVTLAEPAAPKPAPPPCPAPPCQSAPCHRRTPARHPAEHIGHGWHLGHTASAARLAGRCYKLFQLSARKPARHELCAWVTGWQRDRRRNKTRYIWLHGGYMAKKQQKRPVRKLA